MYNTFDETYAATIGIDFLSKTMYLEEGKTIRFTIMGYCWTRKISIINTFIY